MEGFRFVSVICEYNPFHFGHKFQLDELKKHFDGVVCIMSGDIVQRGTPAIAGKYLRAETALNNGADLVLELPIPWSCSSARDFAFGGVSIAKAIGSDSLAFGAEDDFDLLCEIFSFTKTDEFSDIVKNFVVSGRNISYPQAFTEVIFRRFGAKAAEAVKKPNNILTLEYLKSLENTGITPFPIKRNCEFLSSSKIRSESDADKILSLIPEESASVLSREKGKSFPRNAHKIDSFFIGTLRQMNYEKRDFSSLYSMTDDLAQKIIRNSVKACTVDELAESCADKSYTLARVRRAINALTFGIERESVHANPPYTTVLALNEIGRSILKQAKARKEIDIVNKPVRALECRSETKNAFLQASRIEEIISLCDPIPLPADTANNPKIGG